MILLPYPPQYGSWLLAIGALFLCSCSGVVTQTTATGNTVPRGWWHGDGVQGKPKIVIDLSEQQIRYLKGGKLVGASPISSGRESHATMTGTFSIIEKDAEHRSSIYGAFCDKDRQIVVPDVDVTKDERPPGTQFIGASMPYFMRIKGGVGMHEGYLPGYPASHGCIRLPAEMAEIFFHATPQGTPVQIIGDASVAAVRPVAPLPPASSVAPVATQRPVASQTSGTTYIRTERRSGWSRSAQPALRPAFGTTQYLQ